MRIFDKHGAELVFDCALTMAWGLYAAQYLGRAITTGRIVDVQLFVFVTILATLVAIRRPARKTGTARETALATIGTLVPPVLLRPASGGLPFVGEALQTASLVGVILAAVSLGPSFGLAPADRGLRTGGLYRWIRHPLYAGEIAFCIGYLASNPSPRNLVVLALIIVIQVVRIYREERILERYEEYASRVRWRLLPFVW